MICKERREGHQHAGCRGAGGRAKQYLESPNRLEKRKEAIFDELAGFECYTWAEGSVDSSGGMFGGGVA